MSFIKTTSLALLITIAMPLLSMDQSSKTMIRKKDIPAYQAHRLAKDIQEVQASATPVELARLKINAANACGWKAPYLQVALASKLAVFQHFLDADAPIFEDENQEHPMDTAIRVNYLDGIDALFKHGEMADKCRYQWGKCTSQTLYHFAAQMHIYYKDYPNALGELSAYVIQQCPTETAREFAKRNLLSIPTYSHEFLLEEYGKRVSEKSTEHENTIQNLPNRILTLYANNSADLPTAPYETAKRHALHDAIKHDKTKIEKILKDNPIDFADNSADEALAWNTYAALLILSHQKNNNLKAIDTLKDLEQRKIPLPDGPFVTTLMNGFLASCKSDNAIHQLHWLLEHDANPNGIVDGPLKHPIWIWPMTLKYIHPLFATVTKNNKNTVQEVCALFQQHGATEPSTDEWFEYLNECGRIHNEYARMHVAFHILEMYKDIVKDERIANLLCDWSEYGCRNDDIVEMKNSVIDTAWRYTSANRYIATKALENVRNAIAPSSSQQHYLALPPCDTHEGQQLVGINSNNAENKKKQ